nr:hypothetical protein [Tanacetum cinerariifolium]
MSRVSYNCKKEGHFAKDSKKAKVKDYEYYKTKMLLAKKDKEEQVLLAEDQAWIESSSDSDQELNANMVFMAQIEKVLSDSEASSSSADKKIYEADAWFKYGEQDRKAAILYEYETFKANEGEQLLETYIRYLQVINDLKKCGYKKDNCELNYKFLNNLQPKRKQYGDVNDALGYKKKAIVITSYPLALVAEKTNSDDKKEDKKDDEKKMDMSKVKCYNSKKEGQFAKDCKKVKVKDYNYFKIKMLLAKKDNDKQVLLADDQAWMKSSIDSDQEINANMVFMA